MDETLNPSIAETNTYENEPQEYPTETTAENYTITITPLNYGYIVTIGCQKFAVESSSKLIKELDKYLTNPNEVSKNWLKTKKL